MEKSFTAGSRRAERTGASAVAVSGMSLAVPGGRKVGAAAVSFSIYPEFALFAARLDLEQVTFRGAQLLRHGAFPGRRRRLGTT
jgi:hypothetical protein